MIEHRIRGKAVVERCYKRISCKPEQTNDGRGGKERPHQEGRPGVLGSHQDVVVWRHHRIVLDLLQNGCLPICRWEAHRLPLSLGALISYTEPLDEIPRCFGVLCASRDEDAPST